MSAKEEHDKRKKKVQKQIGIAKAVSVFVLSSAVFFFTLEDGLIPGIIVNAFGIFGVAIIYRMQGWLEGFEEGSDSTFEACTEVLDQKLSEYNLKYKDAIKLIKKQDEMLDRLMERVEKEHGKH